MLRFGEFEIGLKFNASCITTEKELDKYLGFARVKSRFLDEGERADKSIIPGRALQR